MFCGNLILNEGPDADGIGIFGNAPGHARIEEMDLNGIFHLRRLPKHSPFLTLVDNAISCCEAAMKSIVQEENDTFINAGRLRAPGVTLQHHQFDHLKSIADRTNGQITPQKCRGWYNHTMRYIPDCLAMEAIDG